MQFDENGNPINQEGTDGNGQEGNGDNSNNSNNNDGNSNNQGSGNEGNSNSSSQGANSGNEGKEKTFTQEQVNRMMAREKNQGRSAALKELGIDANDTKTMNLVKAILAANKSEENSNQEKDSAIEQANQRALKAEIKAEAMVAGVNPEFIEDVVIMASAKITDDKDAKTVIEEIKAKYATLFSGSSNTSGNSNNSSNSGNNQNKGTGSSLGNNSKNNGFEVKGIGARLAAKKTGNNADKFSYWANK